SPDIHRNRPCRPRSHEVYLMRTGGQLDGQGRLTPRLAIHEGARAIEVRRDHERAGLKRRLRGDALRSECAAGNECGQPDRRATEPLPESKSLLGANGVLTERFALRIGPFPALAAPPLIVE